MHNRYLPIRWFSPQITIKVKNILLGKYSALLRHESTENQNKLNDIGTN